MSTVDDILAHYGKSGMRWGKRGAVVSGPTEVSVKTSGSKINTFGGKKQPAHADAINARVTSQKLKKSGMNSLSNHEMQNLALRVNLEKQVSSLSTGKFDHIMKALLSDTGPTKMSQASNGGASRQVESLLHK